MFMIVTFPWPVAAAHVELIGPHQPDPAMSDRTFTEDIVDHRVRHIEQLIRWTDRERLRFQWYRLRIAINDARRRRAQASAPTSNT